MGKNEARREDDNWCTCYFILFYWFWKAHKGGNEIDKRGKERRGNRNESEEERDWNMKEQGGRRE